MTVDYTHVLVITVLEPILALEIMDQYPLEKENVLIPDLPVKNGEIRKVFHYGNTLLCLYKDDGTFEGLLDKDSKTAFLQRSVNRLFKSKVKFQWMMRKKGDLETKPNQLVERADGSSGGRTIGGG